MPCVLQAVPCELPVLGFSPSSRLDNMTRCTGQCAGGLGFSGDALVTSILSQWCLVVSVVVLLLCEEV
jgi:hypothetical protein